MVGELEVGGSVSDDVNLTISRRDFKVTLSTGKIERTLQKSPRYHIFQWTFKH